MWGGVPWAMALALHCMHLQRVAVLVHAQSAQSFRNNGSDVEELNLECCKRNNVEKHVFQVRFLQFFRPGVRKVFRTPGTNHFFRFVAIVQLENDVNKHIQMIQQTKSFQCCKL